MREAPLFVAAAGWHLRLCRLMIIAGGVAFFVGRFALRIFAGMPLLFGHCRLLLR